MFKFLLTVIVLFAVTSLINAQEIVSTFKYSNNKLYAKWLPVDVAAYKALLTDTTYVYWETSISGTPSENLVFSGKNKRIISPLKNRIEEISNKDTTFILVEPLMYDLALDTAQQLDIFLNGIIQNILDKKVTEYIGNAIGIENVNSKKKYTIKIVNARFKQAYFIECDPAKKRITSFAGQLLYELRKVNVKWDVTGLNKDITAFNVYKSQGDKNNYKKLNQYPIVPFLADSEINPNLRWYVDGKLKKGIVYYYKIVGIDYFGDETAATQDMKIYIPISVDAGVSIEKISQSDDKRIIDFSVFQTDSLIKPSINKLVLLRSDSMNNSYTVMKVASYEEMKSKFQFVLNGYTTGERYFYKVAAVSSDNDSSYSVPSYFFTLDQKPPEPITELNGKIDSLGVVRLNWIAPKDKDIRGYRIFKANSIDEEYVEVSKTLKLEAQFQDTILLDNLTNSIFYYVRVVDDNLNNSINSDTIMLIKPDTIPPAPSVLQNHDFSEQGVRLYWYNSNSTDVVKQYLLRSIQQRPKIDTIFSWKDTSSFYFDKTVVSGQKYKYELYTIDQSDNMSSSKPYYVTYELGYRPPIKAVQQKIDRTNKWVELSWEYDNTDVYSYTIYKCKEGQPFILYKTISDLKDFKNVFIDKDLKINTTFKYKIKATLNSGISTKSSEEIIVNY